MDYNKAWQEYQSGEKPILHAIMSNYTPPVPEITPEQAQKAKFGSALTDTFSSLAEMFAHGQGARVRNREGASNTQMTNARIKGMNDAYDQKMQQYNGTKANAELQDFNRKLSTDQYNENLKRTFYLNKQQQEAKAAAIARQTAKDNADLELKKQGLGIQSATQKATEQHNRNTESLERQKIDKENENKFSGVVINAHPSDNTAQTDASGRKVVSIPMNKQQIQGMANTAKNDQVFMKNHPELLIDKPDMFGIPHKGLTSDNEIAWTYAQEQYNNRFAPPKQAAAAPSVVQWKVPAIQGGQSGQGRQGTAKNKYSF